MVSFACAATNATNGLPCGKNARANQKYCYTHRSYERPHQNSLIRSVVFVLAVFVAVLFLVHIYYYFEETLISKYCGFITFCVFTTATLLGLVYLYRNKMVCTLILFSVLMFNLLIQIQPYARRDLICIPTPRPEYCLLYISLSKWPWQDIHWKPWLAKMYYWEIEWKLIPTSITPVGVLIETLFYL